MGQNPQTVGQPVVGLPVMVTPGAQVPAKREPDKPFTPLCSFGNTIVVVDVILVLGGVMDWVAVSSGALRVFRVIVFVGLLAAIGALVMAFRENPVPRGCGCIQGCNESQSGCCTCPGIPWYIAISGGLGLISELFGIMWVLDIDDDDEDSDNLALIWVFVIAAILYNLLCLISGSVWLHRFSKEKGNLCCA